MTDALPQLPAGTPLALVLVSPGAAIAWPGGSTAVEGDPVDTVRELAGLAPRWVWWHAREVAAPLVAAGVHLRACWDLGAVGRLLHGLGRDDPGAVWAAGAGLPVPEPLRGADGDLFDADTDDGAALRVDGRLSRGWLRGAWAGDLESACRWAELALAAQQRQVEALAVLPDPRPSPTGIPLAVLTAWAESAAALLCVELEAAGLPLDRAVAGAHLTSLLGPRPQHEWQEAEQRRARDSLVLDAFSGAAVDLRSPGQVLELLTRIGLTLPDTRSWRLEPHAATSPAVAALLAWRKAERIATTYGWSWLDRDVGDDGRLRGRWCSADGAAGRMTASAGLHNLPAELRPAVRAEPGHVLVRADLGQVEPRVLAVVSGDAGLARAAEQDDLYTPVAAALGCNRPTAKVAVLAAMYGQTSGTAGAALRDLDRAYPTAMAYLRAAERIGRTGGELRTYGGRLLRFADPAPRGEAAVAASGRYARNAVVQGAAAELFKAWAATVRAGLPALGDQLGLGGAPVSGGQPALAGQIVLCLHDELVLQVPAAAADDAVRVLTSALSATTRWWSAGSAVRFVAEVTVGDSWAEAH